MKRILNTTYYPRVGSLGSLQRNLRPRFPCNDQVIKLFIIWPFHYGPEYAIN